MSKITQYSTIGALMSGYQSGDFSIDDQHSPHLFGIGCSGGISGELTICDGEFWEATAGEALHQLKDHQLPFLQLTEFIPQNTFNTGSITDKNLEQILSEQLTIKNSFLAVNVKSHFDKVTVRRPHRDHSQNRTVEEMSATQQVDTLTAVAGQLIGFWTPALFGRLSVPGFHFHFLSEDRTLSGHVLSFSTAKAAVSYQLKQSIEITNPSSETFSELDIDLSQLDKLISRVEK